MFIVLAVSIGGGGRGWANASSAAIGSRMKALMQGNQELRDPWVKTSVWGAHLFKSNSYSDGNFRLQLC